MMDRSWGKMVLGQAIESGGRQITPVARAWVLPLPGRIGGLVYNRPEAVLVRAEGGTSGRLLVRDSTRRYQLLILAIAAGMLVVIQLMTSLFDNRN